MILSQFLWQDSAEIGLPDVISVVSRATREDVLVQKLLEVGYAGRDVGEILDPLGVDHADLVSKILQSLLEAVVNDTHDGSPCVKAIELLGAVIQRQRRACRETRADEAPHLQIEDVLTLSGDVV